MADAPGQTTDAARPEWFAAFPADRGTRKPSAHIIKAYRQDFDALRGSEPGRDEDGASPRGRMSSVCYR